MKRNKLIKTSDTTIFSTNTFKYSRLLTLSLLTFAGIFLTTIVLAKIAPPPTSSQAQVIDLPNLPAEKQLPQVTVVSNSSVNLQDTTVTPQLESVIEESTENLVSGGDSESAIIETEGEISQAEFEQTETEQVELAEINNSAIELTWVETTVKPGDNLSVIFPRVGLTARDVYDVAQLGKDIKPLLNLKPGQTLLFGFDKDNDGQKIFKQLDLQLSPIEQLQITAIDDGYKTQTTTREIEKRQTHATGQISSSLFEAGLDAGLSDKLIMELAYIFGWDIDFALDIREGDSFKVIYEEEFLDGDKIADGDILAAEFTNRGKTFRAINYTDDSGLSRFYTPAGDSMRKAFSRSPVHFSRISSKFNPNRKHPVLKTNRPHKGVDYAAATGTPILATGDGKVSFVGTKGGYGRTVILSHGGKYTTLFAHMSRYKKGLRSGQRVKQGETIGYIGSSGLATGPHLHYEFRVNGVHRNPLTVTLPKAEPLPKKYNADFKLKSQPLLARLDNLASTAVALND